MSNPSLAIGERLGNRRYDAAQRLDEAAVIDVRQGRDAQRHAVQFTAGVRAASFELQVIVITQPLRLVLQLTGQRRATRVELVRRRGQRWQKRIGRGDLSDDA